MWLKLIEPEENDDISCHLQRVGMGTLICRAAKLIGERNSTNDVTPAICFSCDVGKISREAGRLGCHAASPRITIFESQDDFGISDKLCVRIDGIFCSIRKRYTTLEYCRTCKLATVEV